MKFHVQTLIKKEIEHVFGRRIVSSRDCIQLSDEIYHKTKVQLNPNTLRRFFGLVKAEYATSYSTLTVLSRYCGFQSVDEVQQVKKELAPTVPEPDSVLNFLIGLFRDVQVPDRDDKTFLSLVMHTVNYLNRNLSLTDQFQVQIAKTRNGQDIYFEKIRKHRQAEWILWRWPPLLLFRKKNRCGAGICPVPPCVPLLANRGNRQDGKPYSIPAPAYLLRSGEPLFLRPLLGCPSLPG